MHEIKDIFNIFIYSHAEDWLNNKRLTKGKSDLNYLTEICSTQIGRFIDPKELKAASVTQAQTFNLHEQIIIIGISF